MAEFPSTTLRVASDADRASVTAERALGARFNRLWAAYVVSTFGSQLGFGAFALIAIRVLHAGPLQVSMLQAAGLTVGAVAALPLGPWVEFRRKRPVMIGMDLIRCAALLSIPVAHALGWLSFAQLLTVSVIVAAASIASRAASGAFLKTLVQGEQLVTANARFESAMWTATVVGPPLGGVAMEALGPVVTVLADAVSYLLSACGLATVGGDERPPVREESARFRLTDLLDGWRYVLARPSLRLLLLNTIVVNGLIMVSLPLMATLMLDRLGFTPWEFGLAFGLPCIGGLFGARAAGPLVARLGQQRVLVLSGTLRALWSIGLAFVARGASGLVLVMLIQLGLVTSCGVFNPVFATYRLERIEADRVARALSAWNITGNLATAACTALWGVLASVVGVRVALGAAGVLLLATPLLLPRQRD